MLAIQALYCHLPFCHTICPFCAFAVHKEHARLHRPYLDALRQEIALRAAQYEGPAQGIRAVYFGGGTPSTLPVEELEALLTCLRTHFPFGTDAELAFEVNPEDASAEYLRGLVALGINRVSLGVQSLDDDTLRALGRHHTAAQSRAALESAQSYGPSNLNADLMFGAPGVPPQSFLRDVKTLAAQRVPHLSFYGLDIEEGTLFGRTDWIREWVASHRDEQSACYLEASAQLRDAGYRHYEVSNFALPGREGRQNLLVWNGGNYLGFGVGAHSHVEGLRWYNERHLRAYQRRLAENSPPVAYEERLTTAQRANEALLLALRREEGLDIALWERSYCYRWDSARQDIAARLVREGRALLSNGRLRLTAEGFLVADAVTEALMVP